MPREAPRTLFSLTLDYQGTGKDLDYEVIAVDNGSSLPVAREDVERLGPNFR